MTRDPQPCQAVGKGRAFVRMQQIFEGNHGHGGFTRPVLRMLLKDGKGFVLGNSRRPQSGKDILQAVAAER